MKTKLAECEILEMIEKANLQYEKYVQIVNLSDYSETPEEVKHRQYSWDNPIGIVMYEE